MRETRVVGPCGKGVDPDEGVELWGSCGWSQKKLEESDY